MILKSRPARFFNGLLAVAAAWLMTGPAAAQDMPPDRPLPEIRGNTLFSDGQLEGALLAGAWKTSGPDRAVSGLQQLYFREGYLQARFRLTQDGRRYLLVIEEGEPARFGRTAVHGADLFGETDIRQALAVGRGQRFVPRELDRGIEELLGRYDQAGYPFTQIWVDSLAVDADGPPTVDLVLYVIEGGKKVLREVTFTGLRKTRPQLALELSGLKTGQPYDAKAIEDAFLRLKASNVFETVDYPAIKLASGKDNVAAHIDLREPERFHSLSLALGYVRRESKNDEVLSGNVRLNLRNIGGTLRDLSVFWNNDGEGKNETRLAFKDRFVMGRNLGLGIRLEQVGLDTLYTWQSVGVELERPFARLGGSLLSLSGAVYGDRNVFSEGELLRSWRLRTALGLSLLKGSSAGRGNGRLEGTFTWARKKSYRRDGPNANNLSQWIVEGREQFEWDLSRLFHIKNETVYKGLESSELVVPLSEQFYLGGARTLRGYREDQYHGRRIAYARSEFIVGKRDVDNAYLFIDAGYVLIETAGGQAGLDRDNRFQAGYGFGLKSASKFGKVDLSFGIGERPSLRQTMVHVLLEQTF